MQFFKILKPTTITLISTLNVQLNVQIVALVVIQA